MCNIYIYIYIYIERERERETTAQRGCVAKDKKCFLLSTNFKLLNKKEEFQTFFLKFVISFRGACCHYTHKAPRRLAAPLRKGNSFIDIGINICHRETVM